MSLLFRYSEKWIWESAVYIGLVFIVIIFSASLYIFLQFGLVGLFILFFLIPILIFINRHQKTNKLVGILKGCISAQNGEVVASFLCFKNKSIPGIAILRDDVIILIPIFGRRHKIFFDKIKFISEIKNIPGKYLFNKQVFNIEFEEKSSVLFAVPRSVGERWAVFFKNSR